MGFVQTVHFKPNQHYCIYPVHGNGIKALDIAQDMANYGQLIMYSFHGAPNQRFIFEQEGQMYRIKSVKENKYLNVTNDGVHDGIWIRCDEKGMNQSQLWTIVPAIDGPHAGKGAVHIRSIFGKVLETPISSLENNVKIQQGSFQCADGQTWIIKEIWKMWFTIYYQVKVYYIELWYSFMSEYDNDAMAAQYRVYRPEESVFFMTKFNTMIENYNNKRQPVRPNLSVSGGQSI